MPRRAKQSKTAAPPAGPWPLEWLLAGIATLIALFLAWSAASHGGALWRDEANSIATASASSPREFYDLLEFESFPALWLGALRIWMTIAGSSPGALRVLGAVGVGCLIGAIWLAGRSTSTRVPVLALALVCVNAEIIGWGSTVRAWSVGAALAVLAWSAMRDLIGSSSRRTVVVALIAAVAAVHTTYQNVILVAVFAGAAAFELWRDGRWRQAIAPISVGAAAVLSVLIYAPALARRADWTPVSQVDVNAGDLGAKLGGVLDGSGSLGGLLWGAAAVAAVVVGFSRRGTSSYAALTLTAGTVTLLGFYLAFGYPTQPWYYLSLVSVGAVAIDAALAAPGSSLLRLASATLAGVLIVSGFAQARERLSSPFTNVDAVASALSTQAADEDLVIANPWYLGVSFHQAYHGRGTVTAVPPGIDTRAHRFDQLKQAMETRDVMRPLLESVRTALQAGHRVWIVGSVFTADRAVVSLPPPPLPASGWKSGPYEAAWTIELGNYLRDHATDREKVPLRFAQGAFESAELLRFSGWRD